MVANLSWYVRVCDSDSGKADVDEFDEQRVKRNRTVAVALDEARKPHFRLMISMGT